MVIASVTARYYEPASILLQLSLAKLYHIAIKKVNNNSRNDPRSKDNVQNNIITSNYVRAIADCLLILDIMQAVDFAEVLVYLHIFFFLHFNRPDIETSRTEAIFL